MVDLIDKTPPQALEAEMAVLGAMLIERRGFSSRITGLDDRQCTSCGETIEIVRHVS